LKKFIPFALTLLFLSLLFYFVPAGEILSSLKNVDFMSLLLAFFLYSLSQLVRSLRWRLLLKNLNLYQSFLINSANILFNNLLPARTGELSWFYYARRLGVGLGASLWSFLVGRLYDLISLLFLFFLSLSPALGYAIIPSVLLLLLGLTLYRFYFFLPSTGKLGELKEFMKKEATLRLSLLLLLLSSLSHSLKFASLLVLLPVENTDLYRSFLAFLGGELSSVLPVHSFMGFGTYELAFGLPLKFLGESLKEWLKLGFIFHSFLLLSSFIWGVPSALLLSRHRT
jgi:uncharacterized membrane protein YbhN (UPF0104 family)